MAMPRRAITVGLWVGNAPEDVVCGHGEHPERTVGQRA